MSEIFFNGVWRMDWGLGNPNKTAAIIAALMIGIWGFAYIRRWGYWVALLLFALLGVCLVHTFSRGGLVALFAGLVPILAFAPRPWPWRRIIGAIVAIWVIIGASIWLQAGKRYGMGITQEDRSISNRVALWKTAPSMMVDAPGGWGWGNSGTVFMEWYQPLHRGENYRTLVSSHITWLVEMGWIGRLLYLAVWVAVFICCLPSRKDTWLAVPFAVWTTFFVAALFSSVAENPFVWVIPALSLLVVLAWRVRYHRWPHRWVWFASPLASVAILLFIATFAGTEVKKRGDAIIIGSKHPETWIVIDQKVLGASLGRTLRKFLEQNPQASVGLVEDAKNLPRKDLSKVILTGNAGSQGNLEASKFLEPATSIIFVNPGPPDPGLSFSPEVKSKTHIWIGEFAQNASASTWQELGTVELLPGTGDYLSDWPEKLLSAK